MDEQEDESKQYYDEYTGREEDDDTTMSQPYLGQSYVEQWEEIDWLLTLREAFNKNIKETSNTSANAEQKHVQRQALVVIDEYLESSDEEVRYPDFNDFITEFNRKLQNYIEEQAGDNEKKKYRLLYITGAITAGVAFTYFYSSYTASVSSEWATSCAVRRGAQWAGIPVTQCLPKKFISFALQKFKKNFSDLVTGGIGVAALHAKIGNGIEFFSNITDKIKDKIHEHYDGPDIIDYEDIIKGVSKEISDDLWWGVGSDGSGVLRKKRKSKGNKSRKGKGNKSRKGKYKVKSTNKKKPSNKKNNHNRTRK